MRLSLGRGRVGGGGGGGGLRAGVEIEYTDNCV